MLTIPVISSRDKTDKANALEARATAKSMTTENFFSALMTKNLNVRHAHLQMTLQQALFQEK
ncbi:hypothetical protein PJ311_14095 [Bacillus sp. CLL-7-23]|uniref:Uncharacterized protein n=1 Tax=Bacillus changyiensis TaxID=3004103 RepID=A0ABT4X633_9BACI|nr:hypothetical protein [Bacillus changyiensis]MDA7027714.1 hypothetical protein [Bacillus changyiensis]